LLRLKDETFSAQPTDRSIPIAIELRCHEINHSAAAPVLVVEKAPVA
jgi:hypothetical protein